MILESFSEYFQNSHLTEGVGNVSKELKKATENFHDAQLAFQKLQKEFIAIPKEDTEKREKIKTKLIALKKEVEIAEAKFNKALSDEDIDDFDDI